MVLGCIIKDTYLTEIMNVVDFLIAMKIAHFFGNKKCTFKGGSLRVGDKGSEPP